MADIVLGIGASHSPLLNSPAEDYAKHAEIDASGRKLLDRMGKPVTYDELLGQADPGILPQLGHAVLEERVAACTRNIARLDAEIADARLDTLIIIGDDQNEQYGEDNLPSILVYWGDTIANNPLDMPEDAPEFWRKARSQFHVDGASRDYPVDSRLARHLIECLMDSAFDISQSKKLGRAHGEGHAFGYVHQRLMTSGIVPIVPVALNTYFPPNQPRPARCHALGEAIARAVRSYEGDGRVGILGSGGLSHFTIDEELDRMVLDACKAKDSETLTGIDPARLNSGTSEIRNWITVAGACEHLETAWQEYIPCYRSPAGTGCGMGFAVWK